MPGVRAHVAPPLGAVWLVLEAPALCLSGACAAHRSEKRGISRRLSRKQPGDAVLFIDWTLLRLFPPLRAAWSRRGEQALVPLPDKTPGACCSEPSTCTPAIAWC